MAPRVENLRKMCENPVEISAAAHSKDMTSGREKNSKSNQKSNRKNRRPKKDNSTVSIPRRIKINIGSSGTNETKVGDSE